MSLASDLAAPRTPRGPACSVTRILRKLDPDDRAALEAALDDDDLDSSFIAEKLRRNGFPIRDYTMQRHRRGACMCDERAA